MKIITLPFLAILTLFILFGCGQTSLSKQGNGPEVGSVYWSPYHNDGSKWVGPVVYYLFETRKCYVRASGINNRYGGENTGRIENWERTASGIQIEGHQFEIIGNEVLKSKDRVFFKAASLSEAYSLIYSQTTTSAEN